MVQFIYLYECKGFARENWYDYLHHFYIVQTKCSALALNAIKSDLHFISHTYMQFKIYIPNLTYLTYITNLIYFTVYTFYSTQVLQFTRFTVYTLCSLHVLQFTCFTVNTFYNSHVLQYTGYTVYTFYSLHVLQYTRNSYFYSIVILTFIVYKVLLTTGKITFTVYTFYSIHVYCSQALLRLFRLVLEANNIHLSSKMNARLA